MKHNLSKTRIYRIYCGMKQRCYNKNNAHYKNYGEKGVKICDEWLCDNGLQNFIEWSLNNGYNENLSIDRIDANGDYEPCNCRWITNSMNSSRIHNDFTDAILNGERVSDKYFTCVSGDDFVVNLKKLILENKITFKEIADKLGIKPQGLNCLLNKKQFSFADAKKILSVIGYELDFEIIEK